MIEDDEKVRIAALHKSAPEIIWFQIDPEAEQFDGWDAQTWCAERINETDLKYIRADLVKSLRQQLTDMTAERNLRMAMFDAINSEFDSMEQERDELRQKLESRDVEVADLRKDSERYRWICEQNEKGNGYFHLGIGARGLSGWRNKRELDDLFDSARSTK